jgi:hypothetical protein
MPPLRGFGKPSSNRLLQSYHPFGVCVSECFSASEGGEKSVFDPNNQAFITAKLTPQRRGCQSEKENESEGIDLDVGSEPRRGGIIIAIRTFHATPKPRRGDIIIENRRERKGYGLHVSCFDSVLAVYFVSARSAECDFSASRKRNHDQLCFLFAFLKS